MQNSQASLFPVSWWPRSIPLPATLPLARAVLLGTLVLALALRLWGITFGLPYVIQPDEPSVVDRTLHMWLAGDPNPHYFVYPSLYYDMQAVWESIVGHVVGIMQPGILHNPLYHKPVYYVAGRALTATLGTLTVLVTYAAGRRLSVRVGAFAALFLAVAAQHVQQSHYITVDAPTALFTALTALCALEALNAEGRRRLGALIAAGCAAGLAAGTKYNAGIALALPIVAVFLTPQRTRGWRLGVSAGLVALCGVTFLLTTPYAILDAGSFLNSLRVVSLHYTTGHAGAEGSDNALWYLSYLSTTGIGLPLTALALAGLVTSIVRFGRRGLLILAFVVPYYVLLCSTYVRFDRNLLPLLPFVALLAASAADTIVTPIARVLRNKAAAYALLILIAAGPSLYSAVYAGDQSDIALTHPFTEELAVAWADTHLPPHATLATENWEGRPFELSRQRYRISHFSALADISYSGLLARGVRYIETDSYTDDAYLDDPDRYSLQAARYRELARRSRLLTRITGGEQDRPGPTMTIYEVQ